jgi:hypothetical protein
VVDISFPFEDMYFRKVDDPIGLMALDVLVAILDPSHAQNDDQGKEDQGRRDGRELGDELEDGNEGEKSTSRLRIVSEREARRRSVLHISDPAVLL